MKKGYKHPICGEKLKEVRKNNGKTQKGFVEELDCCAEPKTLREWEKYGIPGSYELNNICDVLHCDADYLLGRMDEKTHDQKFITQETGLTEEAVKNIQNWWIKSRCFRMNSMMGQFQTWMRSTIICARERRHSQKRILRKPNRKYVKKSKNIVNRSRY